MPRNIDPGSLTVGTGLAGKDSIESNALVHPTGGNDGLRAHILDPSRAHMAATTGLVDAAGNFVSDEVEGALAELAGGIGQGRTNGLLAGGTWTAAANVLTLDAGTYVLVGSSYLDMSGQSVTLPDGIQWVYVDNTGSLTYSTSAPPLETEPVLIAKVTVTAGVIDTAASVDARFFITGIDRKPPLTVRVTGTDKDANSEGNFHTIEAALLYLEEYASGSQVETKTVTVRGNVVLTDTILIPTSGVIFQGEGDGAFTTGAVLTPMIDLNGQDDVQFRDLDFICDHATSVALGHSAGPVQGLAVERCRFRTGGAAWDIAISLTYNGAVNSALLRDVVVEVAATGVVVDRPSYLTVDSCRVTDAGTPGALAFDINPTGPYTGEGDIRVLNTSIDGFSTALSAVGEQVFVQGVTALNCENGLSVGGTGAVITGTTVVLNDTTGVQGLLLSGPTRVSDCNIVCPRTAWTTEIPIGVALLSGASDSVVSGCKVAGFMNGITGQGILVAQGVTGTVISGNSLITNATGIEVGNGCDDTNVTGNRISDGNIGLSIQGQDSAGNRTRSVNVSGNSVLYSKEVGVRVLGYVYGCTISGNTVDNYLVSDPYNPTGVGIAVSTNGTDIPRSVTISDNEVWRCYEGIQVRGESMLLRPEGITISGNKVHHCGYAQDLGAPPPDNYPGKGSKGVGIEYSTLVQVVGNEITHIGLGIDDNGTTGYPGGGATVDVQSRGIYARNTDFLTIDGNVLNEMAFTTGSTARAYGIYTEHHSTGAGADSIFEGLSITNNRVMWVSANGGEYGIVIEASQGTDATFNNTVSHAQIDGNQVLRTSSDGIRIEAQGSGYFDNVSISGNDLRFVCQGPAPTTGSQSGIHIYGGDAGTGNVGFNVFKVNNNHVEDSGSTSATQGYGIYVELLRAGDVTEFVVAGNVLSSVQDDGIYFQSGNWSTVVSLTGIVVSDNAITRCQQGIHFEAAGTASGPDSWLDLNISGNRINQMLNGITLSNAGPVLNTAVVGNTLFGATSAGISVTASGGISTDINVSENVISSTSGGYALYITTTSSVRGLTISSNTCDTFGNGAAGAGIYTSVSLDTDGLVIQGNSLVSGTDNVVGVQCYLGNNIYGVVVANNVVRLTGAAGTTSMLFDTASGGTETGLAFTGNVLFGAVTGISRGSTNWAPSYSALTGNVERTSGGAGNWATFGSYFVTSTVANNQD